MLRLPEFKFIQPKTLAEAADILASEKESASWPAARTCGRI